MKDEKNTLPLVKSKEDIVKNVATLDGYLQNQNSKEYEYTKGLIQRGKCFIVVTSSNGLRFYPSRFMGYVGNNMEKHEKMGEIKRKTGKSTRHGVKTNEAISKILGKLITSNDDQYHKLETDFIKFCAKYKILTNNNNRKYWEPIDC